MLRERNVRILYQDLEYTSMQVCMYMGVYMCAFTYDVKQICCYTKLILPCAVP